MSVSLYYSARRATSLTEAEAAAVERVAAARTASFPFPDEEALCLYDDGGREGDALLAGATKLPLDPGRVLPALTHHLESVTLLRRALPDAAWRVHLDDLDASWDARDGYGFPGLGDGDPAAGGAGV